MTPKDVFELEPWQFKEVCDTLEYILVRESGKGGQS
jgi:hypothetical protein